MTNTNDDQPDAFQLLMELIAEKEKRNKKIKVFIEMTEQAIEMDKKIKDIEEE